MFAVIAAEPGEYAPVVLLIVLGPLTALIATLGLDQENFRRWAADPRRMPAAYDLVLPLVVAAALSPVAAFVGGLLGTAAGYGAVAFGITGAAACLQAGTFLNVATLMRAQQAKWGFLWIMSANAGIVLLTRLGAAVADAPLALAWALGDVASVAVGFSAWLWILRFRSTTGSRSRPLKQRLQFGLPLTAHSISQWGLISSDRFVFAAVVSPQALGTYGASYQIGGAYNALASEFTRAGAHRYVQQSTASAAQARDRKLLTLVYASASPIVALGLWALDGAGFPGAIWLGLALYLSLAPLIVYLPLSAFVLLSEGRSKVIAASSTLGFALNVATNVSLVSLIGVYAGVVGNLVALLGMYVFLRIRGAGDHPAG